MCVCERERELNVYACVRVCERERERENVHVCVCMYDRQTLRQTERDRGHWKCFKGNIGETFLC